MRAGRLAAYPPRETAEPLQNPERGFYVIRAFALSDDMDCEAALADAFRWDEGEPLTLSEFDLSRYSGGGVSAAGLGRLDALLGGLRARGKQLIVRFVYDLDGKNMQTEPRSRAVIERHMAQVGEIIARHSRNIFTLQGLFTGNWGEMNGTRYAGAEDWRALAETLAAAAGEDVYLAVRTPAQRRQIVGGTREGPLASRLGLFNDGIFGSESDLGTYGTRSRAEARYEDAWRREDELAFQSELCRTVPNGGEAVRGSGHGEFRRAAESLRRMRASYLDRDYDRAVLDGWAGTVYRGRDVWDGIDGARYIEGHLGYRFVLEKPRLSLSLSGDRLRGGASLKNVGFAPAYHAMRAELVIADGGGRERRSVPLEGDLRSLAGGEDGGRRLRLGWDVGLEADEAAACRVYVRVKSEKYGCEIRLGNTGWDPGLGYLIGRIERK